MVAPGTRNRALTEHRAAFHTFATRGALAQALAATVAGALSTAIALRGAARLAVSGGNTPALFLEQLSMADLDWDKVIVTLVDERFVVQTSQRSNATMVRRTLLQNKAGDARFVPLAGNGDGQLERVAEAANQTIAKLGRLDVAVLGLGKDGHTASFFAGGDTLAEALDVGSDKCVVALRAPGADEPRLSLTLKLILQAGLLALHIEGEEKMQTLLLAQNQGSELEMPIRAVLAGAGERLQIFWAA